MRGKNMTPRWYSNPQQTADRILADLKRGKVQTPGQYVTLIAAVNSLPMRLQVWIWQQMEKEIGYSAVCYLRSWNNNPEVLP
jgi:hypothetical protein